jgi:hypothetical protein
VAHDDEHDETVGPSSTKRESGNSHG